MFGTFLDFYAKTNLPLMQFIATSIRRAKVGKSTKRVVRRSKCDLSHSGTVVSSRNESPEFVRVELE